MTSIAIRAYLSDQLAAKVGFSALHADVFHQSEANVQPW